MVKNCKKTSLVEVMHPNSKVKIFFILLNFETFIYLAIFSQNHSEI